MAKVTSGDRVKIHYTGKLEDGTLLDDSRQRVVDEPVEFMIGSGKFLRAFEEAIIGMEAGEKKTFTVPEAYGPKREELIQRVKKSDLPRYMNFAVGRKILIRQPGGKIAEVKISEIRGDTVILDQNNPLAGKTLIFGIELIEIV